MSDSVSQIVSGLQDKEFVGRVAAAKQLSELSAEGLLLLAKSTTEELTPEVLARMLHELESRYVSDDKEKDAEKKRKPGKLLKVASGL